MPPNSFAQTLTVTGSIVSVEPGGPSFSFKARNGDTVEAIVGRETNYRVPSNLDGVDRDLVPDQERSSGEDDIVYKLRKYAVPGRQVLVRGVYQENGGDQRFEALEVFLLHSEPQRY